MPTIVNSAESLQRLIGDLRQQWNQHKFLRVSVRKGKDRSLDANAQSHVWYEQIARERGDMTAEEAKCYCKLVLGVPIMREDDEFRERYDSLIKTRFTHAEKLEIMRWFPVTSLMSTEQMNRYRDAMQTHWREQGVVLEYREQ